MIPKILNIKVYRNEQKFIEVKISISFVEKVLLQIEYVIKIYHL